MAFFLGLSSSGYSVLVPERRAAISPLAHHTSPDGRRFASVALPFCLFLDENALSLQFLPQMPAKGNSGREVVFRR